MISEEILQALNNRRRDLGMTYAVLAKRSKLSMPMVVRTLSGDNPHASFGGVLAIAESLGLTLELISKLATHELLEKQADEKAHKLVALVQGTSALEAQAVDVESANRMKRQTIHELLAGSRRRLWSD